MFKFAVLAVALLAGVNGQATATASAVASGDATASATASAIATGTKKYPYPSPSPSPYSVYYKKPEAPSPKPIIKIVDDKKKDAIIVIKEEEEDDDKKEAMIVVKEDEEKEKKDDKKAGKGKGKSKGKGKGKKDDCTTIAAAAAATPELSTLVAALTAADLVETLDDPTLVATVLAPTNAAFEILLEAFGATAEQVLADPQLANILLYHVIGGAAVKSTDLVDGAAVTTLLGQDLTVDLSNGVTFVGAGSEASVVTADIETCKAVVHIIDNVLLPDFAALTAESAVIEAPVVEATATSEATITLSV